MFYVKVLIFNLFIFFIGFRNIDVPNLNYIENKNYNNYSVTKKVKEI